MMPETRQVLRARARKNNYWTTDKWGHPVPSEKRSCRRENAVGRDRVSASVIAAKAARTRQSAKRPAPYPNGLKHAWQRKAKAAAELRALLGVRP